MLLLSRKTDEAIIIELPDGVRIHIVVTNVQGRQAKIGIDAPENMAIHREALLEQ